MTYEEWLKTLKESHKAGVRQAWLAAKEDAAKIAEQHEIRLTTFSAAGTVIAKAIRDSG